MALPWVASRGICGLGGTILLGWYLCNVNELDAIDGPFLYFIDIGICYYKILDKIVNASFFSRAAIAKRA